ncbi:lysozyme [Methylorubrum extorquens]|uniref:lysozyme n=1 Tax=Methylorubrum extorquens TaxID=408 RepID=UPI0022383DD4|nr:lysozyme [Methylorubrum extorquens]UYW28244.1 lysozyme [Methylorubrum extorquens]
MAFSLASLFRRRPAAAAPVVRVAVPVAPRAAVAPAKGKGKAPNRILAAILAGTVGTGVAALAVNTTGPNEGLRTTAYADKLARNIPTVCYGETRGVRLGQSYSKAQCDAMLLKGLAEFAEGMEACITRPMGDDVYVAFLDLSYNIGVGAFCKSSVARLYNAGERRASCRAILAWNKAGGRVVPGLVSRREREQALCLKGI